MIPIALSTALRIDFLTKPAFIAKRAVFKNCDRPVNMEIMVGLNRNIFIEERLQDYRKITKEEAKNILKKCHESGLIHTILKCRQDFYALCNCCSCCCVPLRLT